MTAATLPDFRVATAKDQDFPLLHEDAGHMAEGALIEVEADGAERLDFYEGLYSYTRRTVTIGVGQDVQEAEIYWAEPDRWQVGAEWSLEVWQAKWGAITSRAATEAMAAFGVQPPADVGRRWGMIKSRAQADLDTQKWRRPRTIGTRIGAETVTIDGHDYSHLGFFTFEDVRLTHPRFDGGAMSVDRAVFRAGQAVTVLPYDPVHDAVLLVEQFRPAPFLQCDPDPWLLEPVAGIVDAGESPVECAHREALEEAGLTLQKLHFVARHYPSPGATAQQLHSYIGIADLAEVGEIGGLADEGEDIRIHVVPYQAAQDALASGEIVVAPLILSLQWLALHRDRLRGDA